MLMRFVAGFLACFPRLLLLKISLLIPVRKERGGGRPVCSGVRRHYNCVWNHPESSSGLDGAFKSLNDL